MAKIRTIKPELFRHEGLFEAEKEYTLPLRLAFSGLFTCCDREGRFRWRPKQLKLDILPYDEIDFEKILEALLAKGFIKRYEVNNECYGYIPSWNKHQSINSREPESNLPAPSMCTYVQTHALHVQACEKQSDTHEEPVQAPEMHAHAYLEMEMEMEMEGKWNGTGNGNDICAELQSSSPQHKNFDEHPPPVISITLNDNTKFPIMQSQVDRWHELYPLVDVMQELRSACGWNDANPKRRKTKAGILAHINHWMTEAQRRESEKLNSQRENNHAKNQQLNRRAESVVHVVESCASGVDWRDKLSTAEIIAEGICK